MDNITPALRSLHWVPFVVELENNWKHCSWFVKRWMISGQSTFLIYCSSFRRSGFSLYALMHHIITTHSQRTWDLLQLSVLLNHYVVIVHCSCTVNTTLYCCFTFSSNFYFPLLKSYLCVPFFFFYIMVIYSHLVLMPISCFMWSALHYPVVQGCYTHIPASLAPASRGRGREVSRQ